jgi:hypothetical protein
MVFVKKRNLRRLVRIPFEQCDRFAPSGLLAAIELSKGENLPLDDTPT